MNIYCGMTSCFSKAVKLVKGVCPKCGADYATTADVFSIPVKKKVTKTGTTVHAS